MNMSIESAFIVLKNFQGELEAYKTDDMLSSALRIVLDVFQYLYKEEKNKESE